MMKKKLILFLIGGLIYLSTTSFKDASVGQITFPLGNVLVLQKGETRFRKATFKMPVYNGDKIETKKQARCEITFQDKSVVRIDEQTIYTVEKAVVGKNKREVESTLTIGKLWANVRKIVSKKDQWRVRTPAAVVAVRGTVYRVNAGADSSTQVRVYDGSVGVSPAAPSGGMGMQQRTPGPPRQVQGPVQVQGPRQVTMEEWFEIVKAQQQIVIRPDGSYAKSDFSMEEDSKLDWVQWNLQRDKLIR